MSFWTNIKDKWKSRRERKKQERKARKNMTPKEKIIDNLKVFFSAYLIAFVIRLLLVEAYQIPSQSMVPNLMVRDILMVEKFSYGTLLPLVNWKLPGFFKPNHGDIIVFVTPDWKSPGFGKELVTLLSLSLINLDNTFETPKNLVKRVVALPGETVRMSNQILIINDEPAERDFVGDFNQSILYKLQNVGTSTFKIYEESFGESARLIQHQERLRGEPIYNSDLFTNQAIFDDFFSRFAAPLKNGFPEIQCPVKGQVLQLDEMNYYYKYLIKLLIERETDKKITVRNAKFYLEGKELTEYEVQDDYYFAMGDNRDSSQDCRYFGFIPRKKIFGRILFRYFPFSRFSFRVNEREESLDNVDFIQ